MTVSTGTNRRRLLSGIALAVLALAMATDPLTRVLSHADRATPFAIALKGFLTLLLMPALVGSVIAITQLLRGKADRAGLIGGVMTIMGFTAGVRINVLGQLGALLQSGASGLPADTLEKLLTGAPIVWVSIVPVGLLFPLGLITLGLAIAAVRPIPRFIGVLLAVGGVLFPVGRAVGEEWAFLACDLILAAAFAGIAWQVLARSSEDVRGAEGLASGVRLPGISV